MSFPNKYPGICATCATHVPVAAGITMKVNRQWLVYCDKHAPQKTETVEKVIAHDVYRPLPSDVVLFPHQVEGVEWLRRRARRGGILGDDMGLGKTAQTLLAIPDGAPALTICPAIAKHVWKKEAAKFAPHLTVTILEGRGSFRWPEPNELIVTNFEILPTTVERDGFAVLPDDVEAAMPEGLFVAEDEAHKVKNWQAQRTKSVRAINHAARKKNGRVFLLTGTPLTNDPAETYSLLVAGGLQFETFRGERNEAMRLAGGVRGEYGWEFNLENVRPEFAERLKTVMLRRRKDEVLNLPPKRHDTLPCTIGKVKEADAIVKLLKEKGVDLRDPTTTLGSFDSYVPFEKMSAAREALARAKTPTACELAKSWVEDGEQVLVFSAHLAPVEACATLKGFAVITGETPAKEREQIETDFQAGKIRGVAATIRAAGVALTLTAASRVLFVDRAWTPADNEQAEDRAYRIGQTKSVLITTLVSDHPLDERVTTLLAFKQGLINEIVEKARVGEGEKVVMPPTPVVKPVVAPVVVPVIEDDFADLPFV